LYELVTHTPLFPFESTNSDEHQWIRIVEKFGIKPDDTIFDSMPEKRRAFYEVDEDIRVYIGKIYGANTMHVYFHFHFHFQKKLKFP